MEKHIPKGVFTKLRKEGKIFDTELNMDLFLGFEQRVQADIGKGVDYDVMPIIEDILYLAGFKTENDKESVVMLTTFIIDFHDMANLSAVFSRIFALLKTCKVPLSREECPMAVIRSAYNYSMFKKGTSKEKLLYLAKINTPDKCDLEKYAELFPSLDAFTDFVEGVGGESYWPHVTVYENLARLAKFYPVDKDLLVKEESSLIFENNRVEIDDFKKLGEEIKEIPGDQEILLGFEDYKTAILAAQRSSVFYEGIGSLDPSDFLKLGIKKADEINCLNLENFIRLMDKLKYAAKAHLNSEFEEARLYQDKSKRVNYLVEEFSDTDELEAFAYNLFDYTEYQKYKGLEEKPTLVQLKHLYCHTNVFENISETAKEVITEPEFMLEILDVNEQHDFMEVYVYAKQKFFSITGVDPEPKIEDQETAQKFVDYMNCYEENNLYSPQLLAVIGFPDEFKESALKPDGYNVKLLLSLESFYKNNLDLIPLNMPIVSIVKMFSDVKGLGIKNRKKEILLIQKMVKVLGSSFSLQLLEDKAITEKNIVDTCELLPHVKEGAASSIYKMSKAYAKTGLFGDGKNQIPYSAAKYIHRRALTEDHLEILFKGKSPKDYKIGWRKQKFDLVSLLEDLYRAKQALES